MNSRRSTLVFLGATLAAQPALSQPSQNPFQKPSPAFLVRPKIAPLPASLADRLRPIGLLATDPQLSSKMAALFESRGRAKGNRGSVGSQILAGKGGHGDTSRLKRPANAKGQRTAPHLGAATVEILDAWISPWSIDADLKVKAPKFYAAGDVTFRVSGPCGIDYGGPASNDGGVFGCCFYDDSGAELMQIGDHASRVDEWHLGAGGQTVTLKFSASGLPDVSRTFPGVTGPPRVVKVTLTIDSAAPFLGTNAAGVQAANANFGGSSPRSNDGEPWVPTTGEDTLGLGVFVGKGYTVTETKILSAHSKLDAPGNTAPENAYRFARVKTPPGADRLQTVVEWMYGPGESLTYTIEWTLMGPLGQRALSTMPLSGPCDS